jgi:hypothetical protein
MSGRMKTSRIEVAACTACWSCPLLACPICHSPTGEQVRTGIAGDGLTIGVLATLLPFAITAGVVAVIHFGVGGRGSVQRRDDGDGQ